MAVTFNTSVNRTGTNTGATSFSLTLPSSTASGDTAVLVILCDQTIASVSGLGATWSKKQSGLSSGDNTELWVGVGCTSGNTGITITIGTTDRLDAMCQVFSGGGYIASATTSVSGAGGQAAPAQSVSAIGQAVVDAWLVNGAEATGSYTDSPAAFTSTCDTTASAWYVESYAMRYRIATATGSHQSTRNHTVNTVGIAYSVLLGDLPPSVTPRRPVVKSRAVSRAAVI